MTDAPGQLDSQQDQLEMVQQRLALLGKVMLVIGASISVMQAVLGPNEQFGEYGYWLLLASAGFWLALMLDCRGAQRSATRLRIVEAVCLLGWVAGVGLSVRLMVIDEARLLVELASGNDAAQSSLLVLLEKQAAYGLEAMLGYSLILRAAAVPTTPRYTAALTTAVGVVLVLLWMISPAIFEIGVDRSLAKKHDLVVGVATCWMLVTLICYVASRLVHGLRAEVRDAKKLGQYTLEGKLGEGGMGTVYRARHAMLRRQAAIKLIKPELSGEGSRRNQALQRFEREADATANLKSPHTIQLYDFGISAEGAFYYVMELLVMCPP